MEKIKENMREDPMLVVVSYGGGRKGFIGLFLGFLFALGVLDLVGQGEEEEDSQPRWESSFKFFFSPSVGLMGQNQMGLYLRTRCYIIPPNHNAFIITYLFLTLI